MILGTRALRRGLIAAAAMALPSVAFAQQPLNVLVNPLALPGQVLSNPLALPAAILAAPIQLIAPAPDPNAYDPAPARAAAVSYTPDGKAVVRPQVLKATGPRYNPGRVDYSRPYVLRRGSTVPVNVNTAPVENISVPGLAPGGDYSFFVASDGRVVMLEPTTRRVVRIVR